MVIGKYLKEVEGFNLRERLNVYGGAALGALIPIAAIRYSPLFRSAIQPQGILGEIFAWAAAAICSSPITIYPWSTTFGGLFIGYKTAKKLTYKRYDKERKNKLETSL